MPATQAEFTGTAETYIRIETVNAKGKKRTTLYGLRKLVGSSWANPCFRLTKPKGGFHDVHLGQYGPHCDCEDFGHRRDGKDPRGCRHIRGLRKCGFLPPLGTQGEDGE